MKFYVTIERPDYWTTSPAVDALTAVRLLQQAAQLGLTACATRAKEVDA